MTVWDFDHYQYFIRSLLLAHQWETGGDALMGTIIGRHVYLCVISELQPNGKISESKSLKQVFSHPTFTDRAIRLKLREFESEGYITMEVNASDGRTRSIRVTDKFMKQVEQHKAHLQAAYKEQFLVIFKAHQSATGSPRLGLVHPSGAHKHL